VPACPGRGPVQPPCHCRCPCPPSDAALACLRSAGLPLRASCPGASRDNGAQRHAMRICGPMHLGVAPPVMPPVAWLPPRAPAAGWCALPCAASIVNHSISGSWMNFSSHCAHIPWSRQRQERRWVLGRLAYSAGRSRQGEPARRVHNTALMKRRLSWATPPRLPARPGRWGSGNARCRSVKSCRCMVWLIFLSHTSCSM